MATQLAHQIFTQEQILNAVSAYRERVRPNDSDQLKLELMKHCLEQHCKLEFEALDRAKGILKTILVADMQDLFEPPEPEPEPKVETEAEAEPEPTEQDSPEIEKPPLIERILDKFKDGETWSIDQLARYFRAEVSDASDAVDQLIGEEWIELVPEDQSESDVPLYRLCLRG